VREVAEATRAHVLHSHFGNVGCFDRRTAHRLGLRHVVSFYGVDVGQLPRKNRRWRRRYRELFSEAAAVLCEGPYMAAALADLGCETAKIRVHRLGVDLERLPAFRPRSWGGSRPLRVLLAASFREKKGIPDAIEAIGQLVREGVDVNATVVGDGGPKDRRETQRIVAAIGRNELQERVRLLGFQPHDRLLAEAGAHDVFMSPSVTAADGDSEGGAPVAIIEMAAMGLPILSTRHCDIPEVLGDPNRELLVPERDPAALAAACLRLLDSDWTSIGLANRELVEREFDCRRQGERLARIYFPDIRPAVMGSATGPEEGS
jgi:colanic acid/amylovoran biosynthesis glycosyltransferase